MNLSYFHPYTSGEEAKKPKDKGLLSRNDLMENAKKKAQSIEKSKNSTGLMSKNESKLLTNDGREIFNENI